MEVKAYKLNKLLKTIEKDKHKLIDRKNYNSKYIKALRRTSPRVNNGKQLMQVKLINKLIIEGHRGVGMFEVHNSASSFKKSIEMKQDYVELDTWLTVDGVVVVVHGVEGQIMDKNGQLKLIESFTSEEIKQIVLNDKNDTIPTLEDIFILCKDKIKINIELKGTNHLLPESIMQLIKKHNMETQIYLSSFYHKFYELMVESQKRLEINTFIKFGFLFSKNHQLPDLSIVTKGHQLNFSSVLAYDEVTTRFLAEARKKGILLCAYFGFEILETEHLYKRLIQLGVTSLITNQPHTLRRFRQKYYMY